MTAYMKQDLGKVAGAIALLFVAILFVHNGALGQDVQAKFTLEYRQGRISAKIEDVTLGEVLTEASKRTAIKINILDRSLAGTAVTFSIQDAEPERFFKALLGGNYVFSYGQTPTDKTYILREVWVVSKPQGPSSRTLTTEINYGSGRDNIGIKRGGEGANVGPASFAVDARGNTYICDTVNKRIQIRSPDGASLSSIQLKGQSAGDISIDKNGFIYVYAEQGGIYQYDSTGTLISELSVDQSRLNGRGAMHIIDDRVYIEGGGRGDVLIARINDKGRLTSPSAQELNEPLQDGSWGQSGKRYVPFPKNDVVGGAAIEVIERDGTRSLRVIPIEKVLSVQFLGEDGKGNSYVKTAASSDAGISVEVSRFDAHGNYLDRMTIPGDSYAFYAVKYIAVGENGSVYQMMPAKDKLIFRSFSTN